MSNISDKTFRQLNIPHFDAVFALVEEVLQAEGMPYYMVGATAIALRLANEGFQPARGTKDIDFAVMTGTRAEYDALKDAMEKKGFTLPEGDIAFRFYHAGYNVAIDLLPFGQIEEQYTPNFTERVVELVAGYREVMPEADNVEVGEKKWVVPVPPLHGMCVLKLLSWSDRPEWRGTDLDDIYTVITRYFDVCFDEITKRHNDLFDQDPFNQLRIAARVLGRKIAPVLQQSEKIKQRILNILYENTQLTGKQPIAEHWARKDKLTIEDAVNLLIELKKGIEEGIKNNTLGIID